MLKFKHIPLKLNTEKNIFNCRGLNDENKFQKLKIKTKLFCSNKKGEQKLNNSLVLDPKRIQKKNKPFIEQEKPRYNSQTNRKIKLLEKPRPFILSAEKRKVNNYNNIIKENKYNATPKIKNFKQKIDKHPLIIKRKNEENKNHHHIKKEQNTVKIKKMFIGNNNNISRLKEIQKNFIKRKNIRDSNKTSSLLKKDISKKTQTKITKKEIKNSNKNKLLLQSKISDEQNTYYILRPPLIPAIKSKSSKLENDNKNDKSNISNGNNKEKNKEINYNDDSSSSNLTPSSSVDKVDEKEFDSNKDLIFKRNITDIGFNNQKNQNLNLSNKNSKEIQKIIEFKSKSQNDKKDNTIIKDNKYLRRRSVDNPKTREKLEQYMNNMLLKQNGGSTLFLTNYEVGPIYEEEINMIVDSKKIEKKMKICSCTKAGCSGPGIVKINQDSFFIKQNFMENSDYFFIGVCDGHGEKGELISNFISNKLPNYIKSISNNDIISIFQKINSEIYSNSDINSDMSGSTVVSLIITPDKLISINLGDSRLSLFKYDNGIYYSKYLNREHKPCELDEYERIISKGGRLQKCFDEKTNKYFGPQRVWLKNKEEPGLAMTRSLGDKIAHNIGVIDEPEIKKFYYDGTEKFIIIASDGLWEYINGEQCINIIKPFYEEEKDIKDAVLELTKEAFKKWKRKEVVIDDITIIVIFFY